MTALEMLKALNEYGVLALKQEDKNMWYAEDSESYCGWAFIKFDDEGNCVSVEQKKLRLRRRLRD
jgi:hypothetical protein